jgi:pimeloyl-ACP methyl ester carboxylesterase
MVKRTLIVTLFMLTASSYAMHQLPAPHVDLDQDPLFDTKNLLNKQGIRDHLATHYNAEFVTFKTEDNLTLHGTYISRQDATHTTIVPGGFYPGNQETMATWARVLPTDGNIILFDARGHGKSEGPFWTNMGQYGLHEYKDILAVMKFAKEREKEKPIIMSPLCAGVLHTVHALRKLKETNELDDYKVRGLIVDSAFTSGLPVMPSFEYHVREKALPQLLRSNIYTSDSSTEVKNRLAYYLLWNFLGWPFVRLFTWFTRPGIEQNDATTRIDDKIKDLQHIPMLCMHAKNDQYSHDSNAQTLTSNHANTNDQLIIFEGSDHANNILKKKKEYKDAVEKFIAKALSLS